MNTVAVIFVLSFSMSAMADELWGRWISPCYPMAPTGSYSKEIVILPEGSFIRKNVFAKDSCRSEGEAQVIPAVISETASNVIINGISFTRNGNSLVEVFSSFYREQQLLTASVSTMQSSCSQFSGRFHSPDDYDIPENNYDIELTQYGCSQILVSKVYGDRKEITDSFYFDHRWWSGYHYMFDEKYEVERYMSSLNADSFSVELELYRPDLPSSYQNLIYKYRVSQTDCNGNPESYNKMHLIVESYDKKYGEREDCRDFEKL